MKSRPTLRTAFFVANAFAIWLLTASMSWGFQAAERQAAARTLTRSPWAQPVKLQWGNPLLPDPRKQQKGGGSAVPYTGTARPIDPDPRGSPSTVSQPTPAQFSAPSLLMTGIRDSLEGREPTALPAGVNPVESGSIGYSLPFDTVITVWDSALPVLQAKKQLGLKDTSNGRASAAYVVSVIGYPMRSATGQGIDPSKPIPVALREAIRRSGALTPRGKSTIYAFDVELEGAENSMTVRFFFPREAEIKLNDGDVLFRMQVLLGEIVESRFVLKDMIFAGKLAISDYAAPESQQK